MPGLYGLYSKSRWGSRELASGLFGSMGRVLNHGGAFVATTAELGRLCVGKIEFPFEPSCGKNIHRVNSAMTVFLDGAVFSYLDKTGARECETHAMLFSHLARQFANAETARLEEMNGEFVLGMYDESKQQLVIANDRWGFRELYYYEDPHVFLFAPEAKAIAEYPLYQIRRNDRAVADFLNHGFVTGDDCFFDGIKLLPPASVIVVDDDTVKVRRTDCVWAPRAAPGRFGDCAEKAYQLLDASVGRRLRGRSRVSTYLSGGLDSRTISGIASRHVQGLEAFALGCDERGREYRIAEKAARAIPNLTLRLAKTSPDHLVRYLKWAVWVTEGMMSAASVSPFFGSLVAGVKDMDLILGGFVGDLILGGSYIRERYLQEDVPRQKRIDTLANVFGPSLCAPFEDVLLSGDLREKVSYYRRRSVEEVFSLISKTVDLFAHQVDLFVILTRCRRNFNSNRGLIGHVTTEEYYPFFDLHLIDFLYALPPEFRMRHRLYREMYRRHFHELARVVWLKTGRSVLDQRESAWRDWLDEAKHKVRWHMTTWTQGRIEVRDHRAYAPHDYWYRHDTTFRHYIDDTLLGTASRGRGLFIPDGVRAVLDRMKRGEDLFTLADRLLVVELWNRLFLDGDRPETPEVFQ